MKVLSKLAALALMTALTTTAFSAEEEKEATSEVKEPLVIAKADVKMQPKMGHSKKSTMGTKHTLNFSAATQASGAVKHGVHSFFRAEMKAKATNSYGVSGIFHVRTEEALTANTGSGKFMVRQAYVAAPVLDGAVTLQAGRWYDVYQESGRYFGKYLYGVKSAGSGSINVNYSVVDGFKAFSGVESINTTFHFGVLPVDKYISNSTNFLMQAHIDATESFNLVFGGIVNYTDDDEIPEAKQGTKMRHKAVVAANYEVTEDVLLRSEVGITDLEEASDNIWVTAGINVPTDGLFDAFGLDLEYHEKDDLSREIDLGFVFTAKKELKGIHFDMAVGVDPSSYGSEEYSEVGATLRGTYKF